MSCNLLFDAGIKLTQTPYHMYATMAATSPGGEPASSETVYDGHVLYTRLGGRWMRGLETVQEAQQHAKDLRLKAAEYSCRYLRDESVGGQAAALHDMHHGDTDTRIWLSHASGLPLRQMIDLVGSHFDARIEYTNVQARAGVK